MSIFSFMKNVGHKLGLGDAEPKVDDLKKNLEAHKLGTEGVIVKLVGDQVVLTGEVKDRGTLEKVVLAVGNAHGIASVDTSALKVAAAQEPESGFYTVKPGDNLWKIAEANYGKGHGDKNNIIFEANKPMLTSPDKIYPGQVLRIPPLS